MKPVFEELHAKHPQTALKIVCNEFFDCPTMPVIKKAWAGAEEGTDVASFDIGLAPLPDDVWSQGKCATKLLQCMAAGVVSVASAVGVHREIIREGVNGCLASTHAEWLMKLDALVADPAARRTMGEAARKTVERDYSLAASQPKLLNVLRGAAKAT
jgi:glycosyltransferase involved in cell wall biosynthesis